MKKKGFTLVELLVVIAIIALLMGILMPALARVRQIAYRLYCGTNLSGIGKAMLIYANDYDDELPRAGLPGGGYQRSIPGVLWSSPDPATAFAGGSNIASCFYLLIRFSEVTPKSFLCKGDAGVSLFSPADPPYNRGDLNLVELQSFGSDGQKHCSYAYHNPFVPSGSVGFGMTAASDPGMAVASDPNPWQSCVEIAARDTWTGYVYNGNREAIKKGNAQTHQDDGQNVLFVDGHTQFEKESNCGVDNDNIFTPWGDPAPTEVQRQKGGNGGTAPQNPSLDLPRGRNDSVLVTDGIGIGAR